MNLIVPPLVSAFTTLNETVKVFPVDPITVVLDYKTAVTIVPPVNPVTVPVDDWA